ncbi:lipopolysaccharide assembly protein LapA domain-containing protein [Acidisoma sp. C75]
MLRLIPAFILVLILIVFGLSNREIVTLGFWPTGYSLALPLSLAILIGMAIAFFLGGAVVTLDHWGLRRRARRAEAQVARLQAELTAAEARRTPPLYRAAPAVVAPAVVTPTAAPSAPRVDVLPPAKG